MQIRSRKMLAAALGLWIGPLSATYPVEPSAPVTASRSALEPGRLQSEKMAPAPVPLSANQRTANAVAQALKTSGRLRHYSVDVHVRDGVATLSGLVGDVRQWQEVMTIARAVPGVVGVRDGLVIGSPPTLVQAQAGEPANPFLPPPPAGGQAETGDKSLPPEPSNIMPGFPGGGSPAPNYMPPRMPPYAWPTYAPYNNVSRVAYPESYPAEAWPFIGPMYPFPKVPLGWRGVKLEWQDGHWWYGKTATGHDWWRIRYW